MGSIKYLSERTHQRDVNTKDRSNKASWWRHQMEAFFALLTLCTGNSPAIGEFPTQRPVTRSFDVLICAWINGSVNNREASDLRRRRAHYDVIVMLLVCDLNRTPIVMAKYGGSCVHFQESPLAGEPRERLFHIHSVHRCQLCAKYLYPSTLLWQINCCNL